MTSPAGWVKLESRSGEQVLAERRHTAGFTLRSEVLSGWHRRLLPSRRVPPRAVDLENGTEEAKS